MMDRILIIFGDVTMVETYPCWRRLMAVMAVSLSLKPVSWGPPSRWHATIDCMFSYCSFTTATVLSLSWLESWLIITVAQMMHSLKKKNRLPVTSSSKLMTVLCTWFCSCMLPSAGQHWDVIQITTCMYFILLVYLIVCFLFSHLDILSSI